jgi:hypothetical protein
VGVSSVLLVATTAATPVKHALEREGVPFELALVHDDLDYARIVADRWATGIGFVLLEHDVVPWPGALTTLLNCSQPWCVHRYPFAPGAVRWALGCARFSDELVFAHPQVVDDIRGVHWSQLDGALMTSISRHTRLHHPHIHEPPFANVKGSLCRPPLGDSPSGEGV